MTEYYNQKTGETIFRDEPNDVAINFDGSIMIVEMDCDGIITYANKKFRDATGYSKEELVGLTYDISYHPDMPEGLCMQAFDVASNGKIWSGYVKSISKNGEYFWSSVCLQPKLDDDNRLIGYIINKKPTDKDIIKKVSSEYESIKNSNSLLFKSEYCGAIYNPHKQN